MLYGNIIFIKKTGGDGSKYPVTQKSINIGRSKHCLIRIHNLHVAPEHCQLIVDENGQAKLRNLSNHTILNGKPMSQEEANLCHGDIFKLGERLARWEYLPSSKYYKQLLSPSGRLVAVVMPQQRTMKDQITSGPSNSRISIFSKRYSERIISDTGSEKKILSSTNNKGKSVNNVKKFLAGRYSLQIAKMQSAKVKQRKSTLGISNSKTSKTPTGVKSRKSALPSWNINPVSPQTVQSPSGTKSPDSKPSNKLTEKLVKSVRKSAVKTPHLKSIAESPAKHTEVPSSFTRRLSRSPTEKANSLITPENKISSKAVRLINSEKKLNSTAWKCSGSSKNVKRLSLALNPMNKTPTKSTLRKMFDNFSKTVMESAESPKTLHSKVFNSYVLLEQSKTNGDELISVKEMETLSKTPAGKKNTAGSKSPVKSAVSSRKITSPPVGDKVSQSKDKSNSANSQSSTPARSRSAVKKPTPGRKSQLEEKSKSAKGVRRKLSPSISSAERAAKKLKTSSPRKPDKNKKAALLVLGKANRRQFLSQNVKVLLKQKIVKKAIKQSTTAPVHKDGRALGRKGPKKSATKPKKIINKPKTKKSKPVEASETQNEVSVTAKLPSAEEQTPKPKKEENLNRSRLITASASKTPVDETPLKSPPKQIKKSETSYSPIKQCSINLNSSFGSSFSGSESYVFGSNRRSKRLSSKNELSRPDFMELSPTALGLIPKNVQVFKTPKEKKRRSSSLATPKNARMTAGIMKAASTSKIGNRKSARFSSKDFSPNSTSWTPNTTQGTDFDFDSVQTPNVTTDMFVSPLGEKTPSSVSKKVVSKSAGDFTPAGDESSRNTGTATKSPKYVRNLLQSPVFEKSPKKTPSGVIESEESSKASAEKVKQTDANKSPKNDVSNSVGVRQLFVSLKKQKSPSNDLTDVRGVKKLLRTPKVQKSPKNDLTDVRGVKKLLRTPTVRRSPKNDLTDVRGVKKLLRTPKVQRSPKNDLTDVRGVRQLLKTPREQKSPKNDLTDVRGVKQLLKSPRVQKSPKNELTDLRGVKQLLKSPREQKSPKNDLTDVTGVKQLMKTPRTQKGPLNELSDLRGVRQLLGSPKLRRSPKNDLMEVSGVGELFESPKTSEKSKNTPQSQRSRTGVKQLLIAKSPAPDEKFVMEKSEWSDLKAIRGRRTIYSSPKNDLSDLQGVRELFSRHKPTSNLNMNFTGVAELFDFSNLEVKSTKKEASRSLRKNSVSEVQGSETSEGVNKNEESEEVATRRDRTRRGATTSKKEASGGEDTLAVGRKLPKRKAVEKEGTAEPKKPTRRTAKSQEVKTRGRKSEDETSADPSENDSTDVRASRKRKVAFAASRPSPPKLRRRQAVSQGPAAGETAENGTTKRATSRGRSKIEAASEKKTTSRKKVSEKDGKASKVQSITTKTATKISAEPISKVQKGRSQATKGKRSESKDTVSPRKTRSVKTKVGSQEKKPKVQTKTVRMKVEKNNKVSPGIKKSTRRK